MFDAEIVFDTGAIAAAAVLGAVAIGFGIVRREPPLAIATQAVGIALAIAAFRWVTLLNGEAGTPALLMAIGAILWQIGIHRARDARAATRPS